MKPKKIVLLCTALALCFALCGCASKEAQEVISSIDAIGTVTLDSKPAIDAANIKYDSLTEDQKKEVGNLSKLREAEERYAEVECISNIASGLEACQGIAGGKFSSFTDVMLARAEGVAAELDAVSEYSAQNFENEDFGQLIEEYKASLSSMTDGLVGYPNEADKFNRKYIEEGHRVREACLNKFSESYGLAADAVDKATSVFSEGVDTMALANSGNMVSVSTSQGDVEASVEGFVFSGIQTQRALESGEAREGQSFGYLLCTVRNESYADKYEADGFLGLSSFLIAFGVDGIALSPWNSSWGYSGYEDAVGGFAAISKGQTKKIAIPYILDGNMSEIGIQLGADTYVVVPVATE